MAPMWHYLVVALTALPLSAPSTCNAGDTVSIDLRGRVQPECTVKVTSSKVDLGDIMTGGTRTIPLQLHCNTPFRYEIRSQHGGLKHAQAASAPRNFTTVVPYTVVVRIPTSATDIVDTCSSIDLAKRPIGCRLSHSGTGISADRAAELTVMWNADQRTVAGAYSDIIILRVEPRY
jgi:hypothetical protein